MKAVTAGLTVERLPCREYPEESKESHGALNRGAYLADSVAIKFANVAVEIERILR